MCLRGEKWACAENTSTDHFVSFAETREVQGAAAKVENPGLEDYMEMFLVMPEGDDTVLGQFAETVYVPPDGIIPPMHSEGSTEFPATFRIKIVYHADATVGDRTVRAWLRMRK